MQALCREIEARIRRQETEGMDVLVKMLARTFESTKPLLPVF
jgi:hypothetical protein